MEKENRIPRVPTIYYKLRIATIFTTKIYQIHNNQPQNIRMEIKKWKLNSWNLLFKKGKDICFDAGKYKGNTRWVGAAAENGSAKKMCFLIDSSYIEKYY